MKAEDEDEVAAEAGEDVKGCVIVIELVDVMVRKRNGRRVSG